MNLFELGYKQLGAEGKTNINMLDVIDKAVVIRKWLDRRPKLGDIFLSGKQPSKQLKYYYKKTKQNKI